MKNVSRYAKSRRIACFAVVIATLGLWGCAGSGTSAVAGGPSAKYVVGNLVSDQAGVAAVTDPNLKNPWGISFAPSGPFWISDNATGLSTLYDGAGAIKPLVVTIPAAGGAANGPVTGQVFNSTTDFSIPGSGPAAFIFDNEDGVLSAWGSGNAAVTVNDRSATGAVYKGLAMGVSAGANFLYATNFNSGFVDVFDRTFALHSSFTDTTLPAGFAPFGITNIRGQLYVSFAKQNAAKHDDVAGAGNGFVDIFRTDGTMVKRLTSNGPLNSPWGMALAPAGYGKFGGQLLVGNFGDGWINVFDPATGAFHGALSDPTGTPIVIPGLWGLSFGNGSGAGLSSVLYFTAGSNHEADGLFGSISST